MPNFEGPHSVENQFEGMSANAAVQKAQQMGYPTFVAHERWGSVDGFVIFNKESAGRKKWPEDVLMRYGLEHIEIDPAQNDLLRYSSKATLEVKYAAQNLLDHVKETDREAYGEDGGLIKRYEDLGMGKQLLNYFKNRKDTKIRGRLFDVQTMAGSLYGTIQEIVYNTVLRGGEAGPQEIEEAKKSIDEVCTELMAEIASIEKELG